MLPDVLRIVIQLGMAEAIALRIMDEARLGVLAILERLAEREMEMEAVVVAEPFRVQGRPHGVDIGILEADRLEIGQAPPDFAERWPDGDGAAIGGNALGLL